METITVENNHINRLLHNIMIAKMNIEDTSLDKQRTLSRLFKVLDNLKLELHNATKNAALQNW